MSLPKPGTKVEDLKCPKCQKTFGQVVQEDPKGQVNCNDAACPQKLPAVGEVSP